METLGSLCGFAFDPLGGAAAFLSAFISVALDGMGEMRERRFFSAFAALAAFLALVWKRAVVDVMDCTDGWRLRDFTFWEADSARD